MVAIEPTLADVEVYSNQSPKTQKTFQFKKRKGRMAIDKDGFVFWKDDDEEDSTTKDPVDNEKLNSLAKIESTPGVQHQNSSSYDWT